MFLRCGTSGDARRSQPPSRSLSVAGQAAAAASSISAGEGTGGRRVPRLLRRAVPLAVLVAAAAAAPAAGFGPPGFHLVDGGRPAACLQGAGERLAFVAGAIGEPEIRLLAPSPTAAAPFGARPSLRPGPMLLCPQVAASPDGRVVAAVAWVGSGPRAQVRVVVEGEAPVTLAEPKDGAVGGPADLAIAVGDAGDVVVAWAERVDDAESADARARALPRGAAPAGRRVRHAGSLGAARRVAGETAFGLAVGVDAGGAATVALAERATTRSNVTVEAFSAPSRDAPLGPPQRLSSDAAPSCGRRWP